MLRQVIEEHHLSDRLLHAGLNPTRAALLVGPPGVGKTLATRWISRELKLPLLVLDLSTVMSSFLGKTGGNLRRVLDYAKQAPCVLLLDELDAIAKRRDDQVEVGELKRLVTVLLQEIDEWPASSLLIAATNHSELLDPAIWRRFDVIVDFPIPDTDLLRSSVEQLLRDSNIDGAIINMLAMVLTGCSFSEAEREINTARRVSIVKSVALPEALLEVIVRRVASLGFDEKRKLAAELVSRNLISQRKASALLRISRDAIRDGVRLADGVS
jgi:SpoVK/Ycf46/Vps4 family AAA+-type ATPase